MTFSSARFPLAVEYKPHHFCICTVTNALMRLLLGDRPEYPEDLPSPRDTVRVEQERAIDVSCRIPTPPS